ncbi:cytochrome P450 6B1-like [Choristoneura fumiferana]|uniref:cytochrome P450 6B1-like n=1 Tax=Choristoneura fumiferana TaxID=7141 RepID=UPI003D159DA9
MHTQGLDYWEKKDIRHEKPLPFVGSVGRIIRQKMSMTEYFTELYKKYPEEKLVAYYFSREPAVVLRDPELVKHVLVTDFQYFYRRGINYHRDVTEPMLKNLFFADGDLWKLLRQRLTPAFTSGKLKAMFPLIVVRTERLQHMARAAGGERLGLMQSLAGLAALLSQFQAAPSANTLRTPLKDPAGHVVQSIKGGVPLSLTFRKNK